MNAAQIKHMVDRFLGWYLPADFRPDAGISFKATFNEHMPFGPMYHNPCGTNLFNASQAEEMVRYMIVDLPQSLPEPSQAATEPQPASDLVIHDLTGTEEWREYDFEGRVYRINKPVSVAYRPGGTTHRVTDEEGVIHCVPAPGLFGCVLRFKGALVF